jgi:hypothetical protein
MTRLLTAVLLALMMVSALPDTGWARQDELDCRAFETYDEANTYYAEHPDAADAIDDDGDGEACEVYFGLEARDGLPAESAASSDAAVTDDLDCEDFSTQEEAQATLDDDPGDPNNLDPNLDGIACALLPSAEDSSVAFAQDATDATAEETEDRAARKAARQAEREQDAGAENQDAQDSAALTCNDFFTQEEAQAAFDDDPEGQADLDQDGDGIACGDLPSAADQEQDDPQADTADENTNGQKKRNRRNRDQPAEEETVVDTPVTVGKEDLDCIDFEFQEDAQEVYNRDPADPFNLDPNADGFACSSLPSRDPRISQVPRTGVGDPASTAEIWLVGGSLLAGLAALGKRRAASRPRMS